MIDKIYKQICKFSYIYFFGAGNHGKIATKYFMLYCPSVTFNGVIVSELKNNSYHVLGLPVIDACSVKDKENSVVLVAVSEKFQKEIVSYLIEAGFCNIITIEDELINNMKRKKWNREESYPSKYKYYLRYVQPYIKIVTETEKSKGNEKDAIRNVINEKIKDLYNESQLNIARLVVILGTKCSLQCKDCNALIPYFTPQRDLNIDKIFNSLEKLLKLSSSILKCELIGGEPFLSRNLSAVLEYLIKQPKIQNIEITTNGTVIPQSELITLLQNSKIEIRISNYGKIVDQLKVTEFYRKNNIRFYVLKMESWISPGGVEKRNKNICDLHIQYEKCPSGYICKALFEDKLFSCVRSASLFELGYMDEKDYIEMDSNLTVNRIKEFLIRDYSMACDYCDQYIEENRYIEPAIQIKDMKRNY